MRRARGNAMAGLLMVTFLVVLLGLYLAATALFHYRTVGRQAERFQAEQGARAAIAEAYAQLLDNPSFQGEVTGELDGVHYSLWFSPEQSVNNLTGFESLSGYDGRPVPPLTALLVGHGRVGERGANRTLTALIRFEAFPYVMAASQATTSMGPTDLKGARTLADYMAGNFNAPANLISVTGVEAGRLTVTGEVVTADGVIDAGPHSTILGGVKSGATADQVPNLDIESFRNQGMEGVTVLSPGTFRGTRLSGPIYVPGNLTLVSSVNLDDAYLFVEGDLASRGSLSGTGRLFATGEMSLAGRQTLHSGTNIALFAQGDLTIMGGSYFQGLLYSHGSVLASRLNVLGTVVAQNDCGSGGRIDLAGGATVTYISEYANLGSFAALRDASAGFELRVMYWGEGQ